MRFPHRIRTTRDRAFGLSQIPGVSRVDDTTIECTIDAWQSVRRKLHLDDLPSVDVPSVDGDRYGLRPYQTEGARWIRDRWDRCGYAYLADDLRLGKTRTALAAIDSAGFKHILIIPPALVVRTWIREIRTVLGEGCVVLDGRGADSLRVFTPDLEERLGTPMSIREMRPAIVRGLTGNGALRSPFGKEIAYCPACMVAMASTKTCSLCRRDLLATIASARFVICPYDRLVPQGARSSRGVEYQRTDLPGWASTLSRVEWDLALADEGHKLRTFQSNGSDTHRRMQAVLAASKAKRRLILSGTPSFGRFRHLWGQLDWLSGGQYGRDYRDQTKRIPFVWDRYFCEGQKVTIPEIGREVWKAEGEDPRVKTEWADHRRDEVILARRRVDVAKDLPPLTREVRYVDGEIKPPSRRVKNRLDAALSSALDIKLPAALETIASELMTGAKVLVLTSRHASADHVASETQKLIDAKGEEGACIRSKNAAVWNGRGSSREGSGVDAEKRAALIEVFVDHDGAGVFVSTTHALADGGVSMHGVSSVHHLEYHDSPMAMVQAELRGFEPGIATGYSITHWHAVGSIDDEIEARVMPQVKMIARAFEDPTAIGFDDAFKRLDRLNKARLSFDDSLSAYLARCGVE